MSSLPNPLQFLNELPNDIFGLILHYLPGFDLFRISGLRVEKYLSSSPFLKQKVQDEFEISMEEFRNYKYDPRQVYLSLVVDYITLEDLILLGKEGCTLPPILEEFQSIEYVFGLLIGGHYEKAKLLASDLNLNYDLQNVAAQLHFGNEDNIRKALKKLTGAESDDLKVLYNQMIGRYSSVYYTQEIIKNVIHLGVNVDDIITHVTADIDADSTTSLLEYLVRNYSDRLSKDNLRNIIKERKERPPPKDSLNRKLHSRTIELLYQAYNYGLPRLKISYEVATTLVQEGIIEFARSCGNPIYGAKMTVYCHRETGIYYFLSEHPYDRENVFEPEILHFKDLVLMPVECQISGTTFYKFEVEDYEKIA